MRLLPTALSRLVVALAALLVLPAHAGEYTLRNVCAGYKLGRDERNAITVTCPDGRVQFRIVGLCGGEPVNVWYLAGNAWLACKGQSRPAASIDRRR